MLVKPNERALIDVLVLVWERIVTQSWPYLWTIVDLDAGSLPYDHKGVAGLYTSCHHRFDHDTQDLALISS